MPLCAVVDGVWGTYGRVVKPPVDAIQTAHGTIWIQDGILVERAKPVYGTVEMAEETFDVFGDLSEGSLRPLLFDVREWRGGEAEAWVLTIERASSLFTAVAVLVDAESAPVVGRFPQIIGRFIVPAELFTDEVEAMDFLRGFVPPA